jgi:hypothetical protein
MTKSSFRKSLQMTVRVGLVGALLAICFLPGIGPQGSLNRGEAKALATATAIDVPELPVILVPALLLIAGRVGVSARKRAAASRT